MMLNSWQSLSCCLLDGHVSDIEQIVVTTVPIFKANFNPNFCTHSIASMSFLRYIGIPDRASIFQVRPHCGQTEFQKWWCVRIAIELMVEHANEPPSFQASSVDLCRPSCIMTPRYLNCLTTCRMVSLKNRDEGGRVGVDFLENRR